MAAFTSSGWQAGVTVTVYARDAFDKQTGSSVTSGTAGADGKVLLSGLADSAKYIATDGSRTVRFQTRSGVDTVRSVYHGVDGAFARPAEPGGPVVWLGTVRPVNMALGDVWLQTAAVPLSATAPGAPTGAAATAGPSQAVVSWSPPASNGGSPVTGYDVQSSSDSGATWVSHVFESTATTQTIPGLTAGQTYTFRVAAINAVGQGAASAASAGVAITTSASVPDPPTSVSAVAGDGQATVSWSAPANTGGNALTGYDVQISTNGGSTWSAGPTAFHTSTATTQTVTGLTNGVGVMFRVAALNAQGASIYSTASTEVTPAAVAITRLAKFRAGSITVADLAGVSSWPDDSGNGHALTQATAGKQPIFHAGAAPYVRFDGTDDFLQTVSFTTQAQPYAIIAALRPQILSGIRRALGGIISTGPSIQLNTADWRLYAGGVAATGGFTATLNAWAILTAIFNGNTTVLRVNGVETDNITGIGTGSISGLTAGARYDGTQSFWNGDIGAFDLLPGVPSAGTISSVESEMAGIYGVTLP